MAFVNPSSCECTKSELDLFTVPPTQTSIQEASWVEYQPVSSIQNRAPIEFDVTGTGEDYIDCSNILLYVRGKITQANNENLPAESTAAPINQLLHSMFSQVDISLNGTLISSSTNTYAYRAMLETLLSYGEDAKKSQLTCELYYKDDAGKMDSTVVTEGEADGDQVNRGLLARRDFVTQSREFGMIGRIHGDIFFQERYMLNEVGMKLKLVRSKDAFCLMGAAGAKLHVTHASLFVRKVKLSPSVFLAHAKALENSTAKYPIKRAVCKAFAIPQNYRDITYEKLVSGQLPTRLVVALVNNAAFNGSRDRNPFNFHHYNLSEISIYLDGQQQHTLKPIQPNFEAKQYVRAYNTLFSGTCKVNRDEGNHISRDDFDKGYALYAFDLSADLAEDDHFNLVRQGNLRLALKFANELPHTVTVIAFAEFDNVIELDRDRNVLLDFGV